MSELVDGALRSLLNAKPRPVELPPLPVFDTGGWIHGLVDSREHLYDFLEAERDERLYGLRTEDRES